MILTSDRQADVLDILGFILMRCQSACIRISTIQTQKVLHGGFSDISEDTGLGFSRWKRGETLSLDSVSVQALGSFWGSIPDC